MTEVSERILCRTRLRFGRLICSIWVHWLCLCLLCWRWWSCMRKDDWNWMLKYLLIFLFCAAVINATLRFVTCCFTKPDWHLIYVSTLKRSIRVLYTDHMPKVGQTSGIGHGSASTAIFVQILSLRRGWYRLRGRLHIHCRWLMDCGWTKVLRILCCKWLPKVIW